MIKSIPNTFLLSWNAWRSYWPCHWLHPEAENLTHISLLKVLVTGKNCFFTACYSWNTIHFNTLVLVHMMFPCNESYHFGNEILPLPFQYLYLYLLNCYWGTILEAGLTTTLQIINLKYPTRQWSGIVSQSQSHRK